MLMRTLKWGGMVSGGFLILGLLVLGQELPSYVASSIFGGRATVKEAVPLEIQLQRARDLLDQMMPDVRTRIRLVAHEQVEVAALRKQIAGNEKQLAVQSRKLQSLRNAVQTVSTSELSTASAQDLQRLNSAFQRHKERQNLLSSQRELLRVREQSLAAALDMLEKQRSKKALIEQKIESLAARHQLVKARSTPRQLEPGKLAGIDDLLADLEDRIEVANRVLDFETRLFPEQPLVQLDEADLLSEVDQYLHSSAGVRPPRSVPAVSRSESSANSR